jgi:histidinol-phosphate/aromatic aminotransferase/cobyric acid decarboxylase-like protein
MSLLRFHGDTLAGPGMLDFATSLWPGAEPPGLIRALHEALETRGRYPDERGPRAAIAARHGRSPDEVLVLNGACEAFWLLAHVLRPAAAACVHPGFSEPEAALRAVGTHVVRVPLEPGGWALDPALVPTSAELVVIGNPNNPTGTLTSPDVIAGLAQDGRLLVVDESFIEFAGGSSCVDQPGLVVVRSLTKLYSLAGVRAGYLLAPAELVERLAAQRQPWSVNALACRALEWCAQDGKTPERVATEVAAARGELLHALERFDGVRAWPSAANFLLLKVDDAPAMIDGLAARGIAVRPAASFPGLDDSYVRIAVRPPEDNTALLDALSEVLA